LNRRADVLIFDTKAIGIDKIGDLSAAEIDYWLLRAYDWSQRRKQG
jgi:hypothetical protein